MSTTRELLELAAVAMGYTTTHKWNSERLALIPPVDALVVHKDGELVTTGWNPSEESGHSFDMAIKLKLHIGVESHTISAWHSDDFGNFQTVTIAHFGERAAGRRAVLLAAAHIGRKMLCTVHNDPLFKGLSCKSCGWRR
ncbi:hypothetical protein [Curvibacter phage PCA1]|nr:hypothetical protein [Curvibacter phage PCA1]